MRTHNIKKGEKIDAGAIEIGDEIDYGNGVRGLVIDPQHRPSQEYLSEIANGFSGAAALEGRVEDDYNSFFYHPMDRQRFSMAATLTRTNPFGLDFFSDEVDLSKGYEDDPYEAMRLAERYYRLDAIAGRIIELMAQFSIAGMRHQLKDQDIKAFFDGWANQVFFTQILNRVFLNYYLYGNVYILKTLVNYKQVDNNEDFKYQVDPELKATAKLSGADQQLFERLSDKFNRSFAKFVNNELDILDMAKIQQECVDEWWERASAARKHVWSKSMIPGNYTILDPKSVRIYGPGDFGLGVMTYRVSDALKKMVEDPTNVGGGVTLENKHVAYQKKLLLNIPKDILSQIKGGAREVVLDPNYVASIHRMKLDFENIAYPLMTRAFKALHMKNRLREMDNATVNNMITQMIVLKVGSDKFPAKPGQVAALAKAYQEAMQTKSLSLFWNHTLEIEKVPVDIEVLGTDKYEVWNDDIRDAFGVSPILLGRNNNVSSGAAFMSVKGFLENLAQGREDVLNQFVYPEYHGIAVAQGFAGYPEVTFDKFKLEDESSAINTLVKLVQTGILDYQTAVEDLGKDWKQVLARHEEQAPLKDDGIIRMTSPYQSDETPAPGTNAQEGGRPGGDGTPGGQPNSRPKNRNANPQKKVN